MGDFKARTRDHGYLARPATILPISLEIEPVAPFEHWLPAELSSLGLE